MIRVLVLSAVILSLSVWQSPEGVAGQGKHPHLRHAVHELREARIELKEAAHDFGGHRLKALEAIDAAIVQLEKALGEKVKFGKVEADIYKKYAYHPHIHHAIHELKEARFELKDTRHNFGGHREAALRDLNFAIEQLELCLKFSKR